MTMTTILGAVALESVADSPAGVRKAALILAATATKAFILRRRFNSYPALRATVDAVRKAGKIQRSQWIEVDLAHYAITHHFRVTGTENDIPGTGPTFADLGQKEFAKLTLSDEVRLGCAPVKGGYALMPQLAEPPAPVFDEVDAQLMADVI